jgi:hypothetical protein
LCWFCVGRIGAGQPSPRAGWLHKPRFPDLAAPGRGLALRAPYHWPYGVGRPGFPLSAGRVLCPEARVILFGSRATGPARPDSDSILLLILPDGRTRPRKLLRRLTSLKMVNPGRSHASLLSLGVVRCASFAAPIPQSQDCDHCERRTCRPSVTRQMWDSSSLAACSWSWSILRSR